MSYLIRGLLLLFALAGLAHAEEPLPPEQAFRFSARLIDGKTIEARWQVVDGYYMYRDKFKFTVSGGSLGAAKMPAGKVKEDETFGRVETYRKEVKILLPLTVDQGASEIGLKAISQGCWDGGICYPPLTQEARLNLSAAPAAVPPAPTFTKSANENIAPATASPATPPNETSRIASLLQDENLALTLISFFGFGLLLSLTPCVFPMVPILSGIIVSHGHAVSHLRAFVLSLAYVLGMALTYAVVGVAAGLSGTLLSVALQNAWVLGSFALVFVVLSFSMFGFYELQLPTALQSRLSASANQRGGSLPAIALMGALSALIVGPCVAAPLAGALLYIAQTGNAALGGGALFAMALGMGVPLLLVGAFSRSLLPKSGPWMEGVKQFFGVIMLAVALWMVTPVIPGWLSMLGWAALLIVPAIYLHALDPLPPNAHGWRRLGKGLGVMLLLAGAALLAGLLGGARDPLQPLGFLRGGSAAVSPAPTFQLVASTADLDRALAQGQPAMLDFYADWCVSCKEMEHYTFSDPAVAKAMGKLLLLKADVTANSEADKALLQRFNLFGPPGIIFFDAKGQERNELRVVGFQPAAQFLPAVEKALQ